MSENTDQHMETAPAVAWHQAEFCTGPVLAVDIKADRAELGAGQQHQLARPGDELVIAGPRQGKSGPFHRRSVTATGFAGGVR